MRDDLVSVLRVACVKDDAIDWMKSDLRYAEERDPGMVTVKPGREVTWFHVRPLTVGQVTWVDGHPDGEARWIRAFQLAITQIDSLEQQGMAWSPAGSDDGGMYRDPVFGELKIVSERELEHVRRLLGLPWIYEIGKVIYQRAAEGNIRGGGVRYTLPPTSRADWIQMTRQRAAELLKDAQTAINALPPSDSPPSSDASSG